jgi:hypothetical protein
MSCTLTLLLGLWLNPCEVVGLQNLRTGYCNIVLRGGGELYFKGSCEDMVALLGR